MKRQIAFWLFMLSLGVSCNLVMAWSFVIWRDASHQPRAQPADAREITEIWRDWKPANFPPEPTHFHLYRSFGIDRFHLRTRPSDAPDWRRTSYGMIITHAGWPMKSFACAEWYEGNCWHTSRAIEVRPETTASFDVVGARFLPWSIRWPQFFLTTLCFTTGLYVVWLILRPLVRFPRNFFRWRRTRRGLCIACGFDLRASPDRCPECGREASNRRS